MKKTLTRSCLVLVALSLAACENKDAEYLVGTLERDRIELSAELSEPVTSIAAREGEIVARGDVILQLDPTRANAEREQLLAKLEQAQRRVDELVRGPRQENIREARARLASAEAQLEKAARERERIEELARENLASNAQRDAAIAAHESAAAERDATRANLEAMLEGTTVEELDQARAQVTAAAAAVRAQEVLIDRLTVEAPLAGRIESLPHKTGSQPARGATVAVLLATGAPFARVHVPVSRRADFKEGSRVTVRVPGVGEYAGRVRWVSSDAAFTPYYALTEHDRDRLSHAAEIDLTETDAVALPAGLPVEVIPAGVAAE